MCKLTIIKFSVIFDENNFCIFQCLSFLKHIIEFFGELNNSSFVVNFCHITKREICPEDKDFINMIENGKNRFLYKILSIEDSHNSISQHKTYRFIVLSLIKRERS